MPTTAEPDLFGDTSSLRLLRSFINIQGQTVDQYMVYESYIQGGAQF